MVIAFGRKMQQSTVKSKYLCANCQTRYRTGLSKFCYRCRQTLEKERLKTKRKKEKLKLRKQILRERKKLSPAKLKKECDALWSKIIRKKGTCEVCGKKLNLNAHHIIGRKNLTLRFDLKNGCCLCSGCHKFYQQSAHEDPLWFTEWLKQNRPDDYNYLQEQKNKKTTSIDYLNLKSELETRLKELEFHP